MAGNGHFRLQRGWRQCKAFNDEPCSEREAWVWLIEEAAYKSHERRVNGHVVSVGRGQIACSTRFLANAWGWSEAKVRRFIGRLQDHGMIQVEKSRRLSTLTLVNYDEYQPTTNAKQVANCDPPADAPRDALGDALGSPENCGFEGGADALRDAPSDAPTGGDALSDALSDAPRDALGDAANCEKSGGADALRDAPSDALTDANEKEGNKKEGNKNNTGAAPDGSADDDWTSDVALYRRGKALLGKSAGGIVTALKNQCGDVFEARRIIEAAAEKENPKEYVNGAIRKRREEARRNPRRTPGYVPLGVGG